jgi:oligopeptidase B
MGILDYATGSIDELAFEELYTAGAGGNPEWAPPVVRLGYGSFLTPGPSTTTTWRRVSCTCASASPCSADTIRRPTGSGASGSRHPTAPRARLDRVEAVVRRAGDAPRPLHLYGYGSYEHSIEPGFSVARLSMLDRGVVFAVAHVRGGGELGRQWYEDGKLQHKRNTFTDFVAVARHLSTRASPHPTASSPRAVRRAVC